MKEISSRMKIKKKYALNKLFNLLMVLGVLCGWISVVVFQEGGSFGLGFGIAVIALLLLVLPGFFTPYCYAFDPLGVSFRYVFSPTERYLWKNIREITVELDSSGTTKSFIWDFFYGRVFSIKGKTEGEPRFYMNGNMRKSFRNKKLLEQYWDGTITGYLLENVKKWFQKRSHKKQAEFFEHFTHEIAPMEGQMRSKMREMIAPLKEQANELGLSFQSKFLYITKDLVEQKERPKIGYTYTLEITICKPNETNEDHIVVLFVDLIYVRLGKTAYRGVENHCIEEELKFTVADVLEEMKTKGIEAYCEGL